MRRLSPWIFFACVLLALAAAADEIYRSKDAEGNVIFSDTPPAGETEVERVELPPGPSAESLRQSEQRNLKIKNATQRAEQQRQQRQQQQQERIAAAKQRLAKAEAKLAEAKEIKDEDRQHLSGGKRRIRPEYFERVKAAEAEVEKARKELREARGY